MTGTRRPEIITALPVAFQLDGRLDLDGTVEIADKAAASGVDGVMVLGTTGEFVSIDAAERRAIVEATLPTCAGIRPIVHVGAASLYEVLRLTEQAMSLGARELAVLTPYYLPVGDEELLAFYTAVAAAAGCDVYAYVFRDRTGNDVGPALMAELAALPGIVGAKVSGESGDRIAAYRAAVPDDFVLYTGDDREVGRASGFGAQGVVSGIASALPGPFTGMADAIGSGADNSRIAAAQAAVDEVVDGVRGDMARIKAALRLEGIRAGYPRMPVAEPAESDLADLRGLVERYDILAT